LFVSIGLSTSKKITSTRMMKPWTTQMVKSASPALSFSIKRALLVSPRRSIVPGSGSTARR